MEARRRPPGPLFVLLALLAGALTVAACGSDEKSTSGNEGQYINAGDAVYQVQLSRLMNQQTKPDDDYLRGQPVLGAGQQYVGVFLTVQNDGKKPYLPPRDMKVVDTQDTVTFLHMLEKMWAKRPKDRRTILQVGMAFSDLVSEEKHTGSLFAAEDKSKSLYSTLDKLNARFGKQAVYFASAHKARDRGGLHIAFNHIPDPKTDK